jgi:mono/diheme cytochrome c family protein
MPSFENQYNDQAIWSLVAYLRALQAGNGRAIAVPTPTGDQLTMADIAGSSEQRGAAVYYAQGCQYCHGAVGNAPGDLALRGGGREGSEAVRRGRPGMPAYDSSLISDQDLADLTAYLETFRNGGIQP